MESDPTLSTTAPLAARTFNMSDTLDTWTPEVVEDDVGWEIQLLPGRTADIPGYET